ncbi:hypothetical protein F9C07_7344 [Aspergillus flavus]|uniref:Uncharacterized protein n=1 Tax=Aspergillus flavus (strain ATCC 200026 / FGSC A1120 / IAM 13836 / NRRL 3357 / JCM 12722 / SRRC 167) TaxID=332952 RepID=A0A7U2MMK2_ASPFN|nr:hypothetical protein F9C07_7344 [Aspergillus flavus]
MVIAEGGNISDVSSATKKGTDSVAKPHSPDITAIAVIRSNRYIRDFMSWQAPTDGKTSVISFHSLFRRGPVEVVFLDLLGYLGKVRR